MYKWFFGFIVVLCLGSASSADITVPGADGADGAFNPVANTTINLANSGTYDASHWAVVFRYTSVNIPSNVTVTFTNHPSHAPVVWLVNGNVTIAGTVSLDGANGHSSSGAPVPSEPGPGGFRGGRGNQSATSPQSGGFGPGGTHNLANNSYPYGGSYGSLGQGSGPSNAGPTYGNASVLPLLGGSGSTAYLRPAGSTAQDCGGGAGGGAILIAATGTISITGTLRANGGNGCQGGGSGGAIRLVADQVTGSGVVQAIGGVYYGGDGRVRFERNGGTLTGSPNPSVLPSVSVATIWPDASAPTVRVTMIHTQTAPSDPHASLDAPGQDVTLTNPNPIVVEVQCTNVPTNSTVTVRVVPRSGQDVTVPATIVSGDVTNSTWRTAASGVNAISLLDGLSAVQARVVLP